MDPRLATFSEDVRQVFVVRIVNPLELRIVRTKLLVEKHSHALPLRAVCVVR